MRQTIAMLVFVLTSSSLCSARILRVPTEYETIQGALNALFANDTVLVETGLYAEALTAPAFSFKMIGIIGPDSANHAMPTVDPSSLSNPTQRTCLTLSSGTVTIHNFLIRNSRAMHPHSAGVTGGIYMGEANLTLENCIFDSVYYGAISYSDLSERTARLEHCEFNHAFGKCVFAPTILADSCRFETSSVDWAQLTFSDYSVIEHCSFSGDFRGGNVLLCAGKYIRISNCLFSNLGFAPASTALALQLGASEVSNNVFANYQKGQSVLRVASQCGADPNIIRGNLFENLALPAEFSYLTTQCLGLVENNPEFGTCSSVEVFENTFINCGSAIGPGGIGAFGNCYIHNNRFEEMDNVNGPVVLFQDVPHVFRENIFHHNGIAVAADDRFMTVQAEWNYWGDPTGPYHPVLNPTGLGDTVGDSVDFDPWYMDTLFWSSIKGNQSPLTSSWQLGSIYPNPFNSELRIELGGITGADFEVRLFDLLGREVALLHSGRTMGGTLTFAAPRDLAAGVYFLRAQDHLYGETKKILYLK